MNPAQQYQMIEMTSPDSDDEDEEDGNGVSEVRAKHNEKYTPTKRSARVAQILTMGIVIAIGFIFVLFVFTFV